MRQIAICLLIMSANCFADTNQDVIFAQMAKIDGFAYAGPIFLNNLTTLDEIRKLGTLEEETNTEVTDPYYRITVPYYSFKFEGDLEINLRVVTEHVAGKHIQYTSVHLGSSKWQVLHGLNVGQDISKIKSQLGNPNSESNQEMIYQGETEEVKFTHSNGLITKVEFLYYAD